MEMLKIANINKKYGDKVVLQDFNLQIEENKITVILGESGSGKTTLLNVISGLTDYQGEVEGINGNEISFVFQQNRLVDCLTVKNNLKLALPSITEQEIENMLDSLGIKDALNLYPKSLSAGMARRVAIARALLKKCSLMLMDEPLINLDLALKLKVINLIKYGHSVAPVTTVIVTHDLKEAVMLANRIIVLSNGKIIYDNSNIGDQTEQELFDLLSKQG